MILSTVGKTNEKRAPFPNGKMSESSCIGSTTMSLKSVLVSAADKKAAVAEVTAQGGILAINLAPGIQFAALPNAGDGQILRLNKANVGTEDEPLDPIDEYISEASDLVKGALEELKTKELSKVVDRPIALTKKGKIAVAILAVSGEEDDHKLTDDVISKQILAGVWLGAMNLTYSYPDRKFEFSFDSHAITIKPSIEVPHVGATKWPSAVPFQGKLYCFYQGNKFNAKKIMYSVFDPTTGRWEDIQQVPSTTITDGPSAVAYQDKLWVFHSGSSVRHEVWYNIFDGTKWEGDARVSNTRITGGPSTIEVDGKLYCFHQGYTGNDNELWYNVYDGKDWVGDKLVTDTAITASPSAVSFNGKIFCFYQGIGEYQDALLVNRLDPATGVWSGHVKVPYTGKITDGPSAVAFDNKIYLFHQSGTSGEIWFNTSGDGSLWRGDTPLTHLRSTDGLGTTVFQNELYLFYQGTGKKIQSLRYRSFAAGTLEWEDVWADPALQQLGFSTGYKGFTELAETTRVNLGADYGYVFCVTKLPLPYNAYADGTRLCVQYPTSDGFSTTFSTIFDADGIYDKSTSLAATPRYTFAHRSAQDNTIPISLYSTGFLFHQGKGADSGKRLWFSLLDRRTGRWAEMQGPITSLTTGGHSGVLVANSKLYVFYQVDQNGGELYYNILDGVTWKGETKVPLTGASASPGAILYKDQIHCFHQGTNTNGQFWVNVLDTKTDTWLGDFQLELQPDEFDANGNRTFHTHFTLGPSPVLFMENVYNLYNGAVQTPQDNGKVVDGRLRFNVFNGKGAISDRQVVNTYLTGEPAAVVYDKKVYCFHQGSKSDGTVWYNICENGTDWLGDKKFPLEDGLKISDGPAAMALEGKLHCFVKGKGSGLDDKIWHNVLDGANGWKQQEIVPTGSGVVSQHDALAIGSLAILYSTSPPTVERVI